MKTLYVLSGIPGSGKTTWSTNFKRKNPNTIVVSSDEIRKSIGGYYQYFKEENRVWETYYQKIQESVDVNNDINVIADSTCLTDEYRIFAYNKGKDFDKRVIVYFDVDPNVSKKRNKERESGRIVLESVLDKMIQVFKEPSEEVLKLYDECIVVNN